MTLRNVIVMLVLAALCALAWFALKDTEPGGPKLPATWPEFTRDEVSKVVLTHAKDTVTLRRRHDSQTSWEVEEGTQLVRADGAAVADLLTEISRQEVRGRYSAADVSGTDVGLAEPGSTVELTLPKGPLVLRYGRATREGTAIHADSGPGTDVWILGGNVAARLPSFLAGGARAKTLTDLRHAYDIQRVEIVKSGVTASLAERDAQGIWRFRQPFAGFADPSGFETMLSRLVNTTVTAWAEVGAQDLKKYGLLTPRAEVLLTSKRSETPSVLLVGDTAPDGTSVYAMEKGVPNVAILGARFAAAVDTDPLSIRDRSFSRIGIQGAAITVRLGDAAYELRKEGASWDVTKPDRYPGDDGAIRDALEAVRGWETKEFLDGAKPEDHGIDGRRAIEVELGGDAKTTLLFGNEATDGTVYAQRKDADGPSGVERVDATPLVPFLRGYRAFRRRVARDFGSWMPADVERLARDRGTSDDAASIQTVVLTRNPEDKSPVWKLGEGPGVTGTVDPSAVNRVVGALTAIAVDEWLHWDPTKNDAMGLVPGAAETLAISLKFSTRTATPPGGADQVLLIGKRREDGGYYARLMGDSHAETHEWAFVLPADVVNTLSLKLTQD